MINPGETKAFIVGVSGPALQPDETAFLRDERPFGLILFQRNCERPEAIPDLLAAFREAVGRPDAPVLIDQEGGRVQRLKPPRWPRYPAARRFGELERDAPGLGLEAARIAGRLIADDLAALGITVDCLPVLDVPAPGSHDVIGDRAYADGPDAVVRLAQAHVAGLADGGVLPVVKHIPGHGRATADSHFDLPRVSASRETLSAVDFLPFRAFADAPFAMTAHILYEAIDPLRPATVSPVVIEDVIRGEIGFSGCLMTDDVSMQALGGDLDERARRAIEAGCDLVLHCNGRLDEMRAVAAATPPLAGPARDRAARALAARVAPGPIDRAALLSRLSALLDAHPVVS